MVNKQFLPPESDYSHDLPVLFALPVLELTLVNKTESNNKILPHLYAESGEVRLVGPN